MVWLVVEPYPSEKYEFVSWDDEIPNIWKVIEFHGSSHHQPVMVNTKNFTKSIEKLGWEVSDVDGKCGNNLAVKKTQPMLGSMWFHVACPSSKKPTASPAQLPTTMDGEPSPSLHPLVSKTFSKNPFIVPSGESGYLT